MTYFCDASGCDGETRVVQTAGIHRRRKCLVCDHVFITEEGPYEGETNPFTEQNRERKQQWRANNDRNQRP